MHLIWYLLYPFRGTLDPPKFRHENPIRRAFYRHGALTARYWLPAMLASVTIGVILSYPTVFMPDFPSGANNGLPHHIWTGSISFETRTEKQPDLEMRQVWLQGDYMQALNKSILRQAFNLERLLLQDEADSSSTVLPSSAWGIQSPSVYWNHSPDLFEADSNPLKTLSGHGSNLSLLGFELQPLSAFAGKNYQSGKLTAADALIITLVNRQNATVGDIWERNLAHLSSNAPSQWSVGSPTGHSSIYEYKFQPFGIRQYWVLIGAYVCMVFYVTISLRRLKAFRSRSGLVVTAITQMTTSILASFTICGLLRINLDQIPQEAYPFVVLAIGLENIFRLINAVLAYPPEMATNQRIANGVADIGASSMVSAVQNLALLWTLSLFVSPGVAAFCAFAAIALMFDFFFLITFFLAVLNVDIKRLELQDSLTRSKSTSATRPPPRSPRVKAPDRQSWVDALFRGRLPFSTRMAGTVITATFVLALNWHFSDHNMSALRTSPWSSPVGKKYLPTFGSEQGITTANDTAPQSSWIRSKSSTTDAAAQFMHVIKPGIQSFTARIYDPLVVVLNRSDRTSIPLAQDTFLHALRDLAIRHFYPFALAVVFMIAFTTVLMNFLLWDDRIETPEIELTAMDEGPVSHSIIETRHGLDIIRLAASNSGRVLAVGLDKRVSLSVRDRTTAKFTTTLIRNTALSDHGPAEACVADPNSSNIALLYQDGSISFLKVSDNALSEPIKLDFNRVTQRTLVFDFASVGTSSASTLVVLLNDGTVYESTEDKTTFTRSDLANEEGDIAAATLVRRSDDSPVLVVLTNLGSIYSYSKDAGTGHWIPHEVIQGSTRPNIAAPAVHEAWLRPVPALGLVLLCTSDELTMIEPTTLTTHASVALRNAARNSIRLIYPESSRCGSCEAPAAARISIAYIDTNDSNLRMLSYSTPGPDDTDDGIPSRPICLSMNTSCNSITNILPAVHTLPSPGVWEATSQHIAGLRRIPHRTLPDIPTTRIAISSATKSRPPVNTGDSPLRRRRRISASEHASEPGEEWEAYVCTLDAELHTSPVKDLSGESDHALWADVPGPVAKFSEDTVGVAVGNCVVVVKANGSSDTSGSISGRERRQSGGLNRLMDGGREGLGMSPGHAVGVRRSASRSKRGAGLGMTRGGKRKE
ncbi:sterol-sensing domain of SREBP cleavage-activation-domain-containing protein [Elsinoe ampelina]|uniref:Sterol-sensing domain of SREBP cleavage-activation-domain-containing protein n=1 Tax=Elsinoe ampelina TaxID=302913 RepID=A0A6A6G639_9PEZI|nr:sterol-sensing domain of SREBP cleavage-activation-domain-containing protein [Elsinoe ampelina]